MKTGKKMLTNDKNREFFFLDYIPNNLDVLPLMTPEFKQELREQDIYTTNQLISAYGKFNFQFIISDKIFTNSPDGFVEFFFLKLKNHGIQIPPFKSTIPLFSTDKHSTEKLQPLNFKRYFPDGSIEMSEEEEGEKCEGCGKNKLNLRQADNGYGCYGCNENDDNLSCSDEDDNLSCSDDDLIEYYLH